MVVGENGVLSRATNAAKETAKADALQELSSWLVDKQSEFASDDWLDDTSKIFMTNYLCVLDASKNLTSTKEFKSNGWDITLNSSTIEQKTTTDKSIAFEGTALGSISKDSQTYYFELEGAGQMGAKIKNNKLSDTKPDGWKTGE